MAAGAAGGAGLSAAQVFDPGEFVAGEVNDFIGLQMRRGIGAQAVDFAGNDDECEEQKRFQKPRGKQSMIRKKTVRGLAGQARGGTGKGGADGGGELLPGRGPLDQEFGRVVEMDRVFELESIGHGE